MTGKERQRRYVERLVAAGQPTAAELAAAGLGPDELTAAELMAVKLSAGQVAAAKAQVAAEKAIRDDMEKSFIEVLKNRDARIAQLEDELARRKHDKKAPPPLSPDDFSPARKQAVAEERKAARAAAKAARAAAAPAPEQEETIETLRAKLEASEKVRASQRTRITNLRRQVYALADKRAVLMPKALHKHIVACLHPDRAPRHDDKARDARTQKLWTEHAQDFAALKVTFTDEK
jgi:hypothetical protein